MSRHRIRIAIFYRLLQSVYWRARTRGGIQGQRFRIKHPEKIVARHGLLEMGLDSIIDSYARIIAWQKIRIGKDVYISRDAVLVAYADIEIGDRSLIGERVSIHTENHGPAHARDAFSCKPVWIGKDVWIGAGVTLVSGAKIGDGAVIGAGAVVVGEIPSNSVAVGIPAKVIKTASS